MTMRTPYRKSAIILSVYSHSCVCFFLFQSPPKGATIPYRPKPQVGGPVILAGGQAYTIQGNYAVPAHSDVSTVLPLPAPAAGHTPPSLNTQTLATSPFAAHPSSSAFAASHGHPLLSTAHLTTPHHPLHPSPLHASVAGLADPLLKSGHLQAALPPAHLVADAVSLLFFVIRPPYPTPFLDHPRPPIYLPDNVYITDRFPFHLSENRYTPTRSVSPRCIHDPGMYILQNFNSAITVDGSKLERLREESQDVWKHVVIYTRKSENFTAYVSERLLQLEVHLLGLFAPEYLCLLCFFGTVAEKKKSRV